MGSVFWSVLHICEGFRKRRLDVICRLDDHNVPEREKRQHRALNSSSRSSPERAADRLFRRSLARLHDPSMQFAGPKMAASMQLRMAKSALSVSLQGVECLLNPARLAASSLMVPVRTKKRYFIPPSANPKYVTPEQQQKHARAAGIVVPYERSLRPMNISCTAGIFDPYIPPEGDARVSSLSKEGLKQKMEQLKQSAASQLAIRKIKDHNPDFSTKTFAEIAQNIFIEAHNNLTNFNKDKLHSLVTERCYPEMVRGNRYKTIRWSFVESLQPPRVVQVRCTDMMNKGNLYGQVTVRMHTRQTLAIYDRFGRLMYGGEQIPKDVLEYVVLERHLVNPYSPWRLHGKIVPSWAPPKDAVTKTVMIPGPSLEHSQEYEEIGIPQATPTQQTL
ncbi:39S ribosomal protein L45, mitochondrial [Eublepharis macularius]|uniref:Large ribosomal subunit protein mL45 n=1 Tax=Eublepharis macularius TaxID=481883 RepID=A0AA97LBW1_EUBMA|nr:39S ribosomal protein L45, mitochondrial [Eublepharis macularius]